MFPMGARETTRRTIRLFGAISRVSMSATAFLTHLAAVGLLFAISAAVTRFMIFLQIMDLPNHRSSHAQATPKCGGVGIVVAFTIGAVILYFLSDEARLEQPHFIGFILASTAIALISLIDDIWNPSFIWRLAAQFMATVVVLSFGLVVREVSIPGFGQVALGWWGYPLTVLWIVGLTNTVNFMDGLNGLVGGTTALAAVFLAAISFLQGSHFIYLCSMMMVGSILGFLIFNFPRARIFMGDVGSQFLGFSFAVFALIAMHYDKQHVSFMIVPLLFLAFIFDTTFTLIRRALRGERVIDAHRGHLYQVLHRSGFSHTGVSLLHHGFVVLQGFGAIFLLYLPSVHKPLIFLPFFVLQLIYLGVVWRWAHAAGIEKW